MKIRILVFAFSALIASTVSMAAIAANFGDEVADCLVRKGVTQAGPAFDAARPGCEREVERSRRIAQMDEAKTAWHICVMTQIEKIDDGVSTASDVATAVQGDCEQEYEALLNSVSLSAQVKAEQWGLRRATTKELATSFVFKVRKWRSSTGK